MEIAAPYQSQSVTSIEAAISIVRHLGPMELEVLNLITECQAAGGNGLTDDELISTFGSQSARPRRIWLTATGRVRDSGATRKTRSGRRAVVWCLA